MYKSITTGKTNFWNSLVTAATIMLGVFCNTEARVTREVAEATIPFLLEAVGIPLTKRTQNHQNAVRDMIYTDTGQQQMVNWAINGVFPPSLVGTALFQNGLTYSRTNLKQLVTPIVAVIQNPANNVEQLLLQTIQTVQGAPNPVQTAMQQPQITQIVQSIRAIIQGQILGANQAVSEEVTKAILRK
jgi:hypothetical protein